ncbi:MAG: hypothetical protein CM1200mP39_01930 [Dehalococcoidia bacterium]|nr:MAG: hypothetical protein CM1200mP39_01930 [Dehalococcoidia bacterium]
MSPAQNGLNDMIDSLTFHDPLVPLIGNVTAKPLKTAEDVREELRLQLTSCVQWNDTIKLMVEAGINDFYEIGHGEYSLEWSNAFSVNLMSQTSTISHQSSHTQALLN